MHGLALFNDLDFNPEKVKVTGKISTVPQALETVSYYGMCTPSFAFTNNTNALKYPRNILWLLSPLTPSVSNMEYHCQHNHLPQKTQEVPNVLVTLDNDYVMRYITQVISVDYWHRW